MLRRQKHVLSQSTTPFACTLLVIVVFSSSFPKVFVVVRQAQKIPPWLFVSSKIKGPGEAGAARYCPKILLPKRAKIVLCSFRRSHREICTRNRLLSETKFPDDFWGPLLSRPLLFTAEFGETKETKEKKDRDNDLFFETVFDTSLCGGNLGPCLFRPWETLSETLWGF